MSKISGVRPAEMIRGATGPSVTGPEVARTGTSGGNPSSNGQSSHCSCRSMAGVSHSLRRTSRSMGCFRRSTHYTRHSMDRSSRSMVFLRTFRRRVSCSGKRGVSFRDTARRGAPRVGRSRSMGRARHSVRAACVRQTSERHGGSSVPGERICNPQQPSTCEIANSRFCRFNNKPQDFIDSLLDRSETSLYRPNHEPDERQPCRSIIMLGDFARA